MLSRAGKNSASGGRPTLTDQGGAPEDLRWSPDLGQVGKLSSPVIPGAQRADSWG